MGSMRIDFVTIFPRMFDPLIAEGVIARGIKQGLLDIRVWDLRDFATDKHRSTDDEAYGGGPGMVMLGEPVFRCVETIRVGQAPSPVGAPGTGEGACPTPHILLTTPQGRRFDQNMAKALAAKASINASSNRCNRMRSRSATSSSPAASCRRC
jgi:tRNA (guanine37-N1)-methyltransferase